MFFSSIKLKDSLNYMPKEEKSKNFKNGSLDAWMVGCLEARQLDSSVDWRCLFFAKHLSIHPFPNTYARKLALARGFPLRMLALTKHPSIQASKHPSVPLDTLYQKCYKSYVL